METICFSTFYDEMASHCSYVLVQTERTYSYDLYRYLLPKHAPMQVDPTWQSLQQLHMCFAGKPVRPHQGTSHCGPLRRVEGTLPAPYCKRPRMAGWGSP